jgi:hypothetical protein
MTENFCTVQNQVDICFAIYGSIHLFVERHYIEGLVYNINIIYLTNPRRCVETLVYLPAGNRSKEK